jgi:ubiquinol-cytochrome c reductase cytochrome c subunit
VRRAALLLLAVAAAPAASAQPPQGVVTTNVRNGAGLYAANCASCHGARGQGVPPPGIAGAGGIVGMGPPLRNVGAGTADFYLRTGYMPLSRPDEQPYRRRVLFDERQIRRLVRYVASFGSGPAIPQPQPERGDIAQGMRLFTEHCAGCHQVVARGGISSGARVPPLTKASPVEIAEAVRSGPYVMPKFTRRAISDEQLDSIIRYVEYAKDPSHPGGWGLGFLGPVPEGMVTWLVAAAALVAACVALGNRRSSE